MSGSTYEDPESGNRIDEKGLFKMRTNPAFDVDLEEESRNGEEITVAFTVERPDGEVDRYVRVEDS